VTDLLLDRAAAGRRLTPEEVRGWAESQRMFVSSVIEDYREPRQAAVRATEAVGAQPVYFERFGGRDADPNQAYLDEVASCSVYIGLLGTRYGRLLPSRFSATHEEYRYAEQHGLRLAVWAQRNVEREGHQQSFLEEVQAFHTTGEFLDEAELERDVRTRLEAIAAEDLSPWVKLGSLIFRASEIRIARESATIVATIRDAAVAGALSEMDSQWGRRDTTLAWAHGVYVARVESVEQVSRTAGSRDFTISLRLSEPSQPTMYSSGGSGYEALTEQAMRTSWLGEPAPGQSFMRSEYDLPDPFAALAQLRPPAEALRPLAQLLVTEILVGQRNVSRITRFALGNSVAGRRRLIVGWVPRMQGGQPAPERTVDGVVALD